MFEENKKIIHGIEIEKTERSDTILICGYRWNIDSILCALGRWKSKKTNDFDALEAFNINKEQLIEVFNTALDMIKKRR